MYKINTGLRVALERFRNEPENRQNQLQGFADTIAAALSRVPPTVLIQEGLVGVQFVSEKGSVQLWLGEEYIKSVIKWENEVAENGTAAVFGTIARAVSKQFGKDFMTISDQIIQAIDKVDGWSPKDAHAGKAQHLKHGIANSIASYSATKPSLAELKTEMPGLGDAVMASFIASALPDDETFNPDGFKHEDLAVRWKVIWSALMMEIMGVTVDVYGDTDIQKRIQEAAHMIEHYNNYEEGAVHLLPLFNNDGEEQPDFSDTAENQDSDMSESTDQVEAATQVIVAVASESPKPVQRKTQYEVTKDYNSLPVTESPLIGVLSQYLLDYRLEVTPGQSSGDLRNIQRFITDQKMFVKRRMVQDPPSATVIVCVDASGSMAGSSIHSATALHDALCYALRELDIRVFSCAYSGYGAAREVVMPINAPGGHIKTAAGAINRLPGDNGDDAALSWAGDILLDEDADRSAIVFLADGQFTSTMVGTFQQRVKGMDVSVFHVDYLNSVTSPFGGASIHAAGKSLAQVAEPLAKGLAAALDLT